MQEMKLLHLEKPRKAMMSVDVPIPRCLVSLSLILELAPKPGTLLPLNSAHSAQLLTS